MKLDYPKIKKFLQIGIFSIDIVVFLLVIFSTNSSSENYKEYTDASKFFLDVYILAIYAILILVTVMPGLIYYRVKKYIIFIFTDKGKVIISFAISLIYWFARNKPQLVLGLILTITSIVLLIYEFIFHCTKVETFLNSKGIEFSNRGQSTFNLDTLEKKLQSDITPESSKNSGYQNNQNEGNNTKDSSDNNQQSPKPNQYQRDVEISSGFEQNTSNDDNNKQDNNNLGFGF
jgi:hypothetical protein